MTLLVKTNETFIKTTRILRSSLVWPWLHQKNTRIRFILINLWLKILTNQNIQFKNIMTNFSYFWPFYFFYNTNLGLQKLLIPTKLTTSISNWSVKMRKSLEQCPLTFFVMVHPKKSCCELKHPLLKIWNEAKSHTNINMQKDNCTTTCTKNNTGQSTQQIQEIICNGFFAVVYYQPTFQTEEWSPFQLLPSSMNRCVQLNFFSEIWSHTNKKKHFRISTLLAYKWVQKMPFLQCFYILAHLVGAPKVQYMESL